MPIWGVKGLAEWYGCFLAQYGWSKELWACTYEIKIDEITCNHYFIHMWDWRWSENQKNMFEYLMFKKPEREDDTFY